MNNALYGKKVAEQIAAQVAVQANVYGRLPKKPWIEKIVRRKGRPVKNWEYAELPDGSAAFDGRVYRKTFVGPLTYERRSRRPYCDCCGPYYERVRLHKPKRWPLKDVVFVRIDGGFRVTTVKPSN